MSKINENFKSIYQEIINLLFTAVKKRDDPYHTPVFSCNSENNFTDSRIVVLRKFDEKKMMLSFHTDIRSVKINALKKNPNSSLLFYNSKIRIQIRIRTESIINNQNKITKEAWMLTNLSSRKCYLANKSPSSYTLTPEDSLPDHLIGSDPSLKESEEGYKNFTVIQNKILNIDWLHLSSAGHRRLNINIKNDLPIFNWVIP